MSYKSPTSIGPKEPSGLLSYYQPDHEHARKHSASSSDYSYDSDAKDAGSETSTRRVTTPSKGGADRRRVAIMQMPNTLRSRRGHNSDLTGLALVAPPDAAPTTYTHLSPPPLTAKYISPQTNPIPNLDHENMKDISVAKDSNFRESPGSPSPDHARGLTNLRTSHLDHTSHLLLTHSPMFSPVTPKIGQGKDIDIPVAGPVVVNLGSRSRNAPSSIPSRTNSPIPDASLPATPSSSTATSYLSGALPPPPRANFNIDIHNPPPPRPPRLYSPALPRTKRDLDVVKQNLQLSPSVIAVLSSKSSNSSTTKSYKDDSRSDLSDVDSKSEIKPSSISTSVHRREGAFSPLDDIPTEPVSSAIVPITRPLECLNIENKDTATLEIDHYKFSQWLKSNPELSQPLKEVKRIRRGSSVGETHYKQRLSSSPERSMSPDGSEAPSPPPKNLRNSLTTSLKRFSLPRTASLSSRSGRRWSGGGSAHYSSRTPSPSLRRVSPPPRVQKMRSTNPAALFCHEVHSQRTTSERCLIYATKINELHLHDCGLSEWVVNMKSRGPNTQHQRVPSVQPFAPQPRHTSRSSVISEATFPTRPDASTATDLSQGAYGDITPTSVSLTLPYPSLAMNPPRTNPSRSNSSVGAPPSIRSLTPSTSISKSGGFFASLGRKTSLSKKEKPNNLLISSSGSLSSTSGSGRLLSPLSKHAPSSSMISRPINIANPPSVPGGPRAPPHRNQRSQTFTPSFPPASIIGNSDFGRRPSMFDLSLEPIIDIRANTDFYQQVDKLATLLPQANRDVLAGYLQRAGQDMLAIGQYLEDEKNGTIRSCD